MTKENEITALSLSKCVKVIPAGARWEISSVHHERTNFVKRKSFLHLGEQVLIRYVTTEIICGGHAGTHAAIELMILRLFCSASSPCPSTAALLVFFRFQTFCVSKKSRCSGYVSMLMSRIGHLRYISSTVVIGILIHPNLGSD